MRDRGLQLLASELLHAGASTQLRSLALISNQIELVDSECVLALSLLLRSPHCRLQSLLLGSNKLRDEGALKLAEVVQASTSLQRLDVSANAISSKGLCALARAVRDQRSMQQMELWGNRFDSAACLAWIPALHYLKLDIAVQEVDNAYNCVRC